MTEVLEKPKTKISTQVIEALMAMGREKIVAALESNSGLEIEITDSAGEREKIIFRISFCIDPANWDLVIEDSLGEFAFYNLITNTRFNKSGVDRPDIKAAEISNKAYLRRQDLRGVGLMKIGFSLLVEYCRYLGLQAIYGYIKEDNLRSLNSRTRAIDLTNGGNFVEKTKKEPTTEITASNLQVTYI